MHPNQADQCVGGKASIENRVTKLRSLMCQTLSEVRHQHSVLLCQTKLVARAVGAESGVRVQLCKKRREPLTFESRVHSIEVVLNFVKSYQNAYYL